MKPASQARSLKRRLALGVFVANLFVVCLSAFSLRQSWHQLEERANVGTRNLAQVLEEEIGGDIGKIDASLLTIGEEMQRRMAGGAPDGAEMNAFLARQLSHLPEAVGLRVADGDGKLRYGAGTGRPSPGSADRGIFLRQRQAGFPGLVFGGPVLAHSGGHWSIPVSRRIARRDGSFTGIVQADLAVGHLAGTFRKLDLGPHGVAHLRDENLKILAHYPEVEAGSILGRPASASPLASFIASGLTAGTYRAEGAFDGVDRTFSFRKIGAYPLYVTVGFAHEDYMAEWWPQLATLLVWQILFLAFTIAAARKVFQSWSRQRTALDSLHSSEERFHFTLENSPIGIAVVSLDGRFLEVNGALCQILGYERRELTKLGFQAVTHRDDVDAVRDRTRRLLGGDIRSYQTEKRCIRRDGAVIWVQAAGSIVRDAAGAPLHFVIQLEDITERRRATEQLNLSAKVFEESGECIVVTDEQERILSVNKAFSRVTGYAPEEVLGKTPRVMHSGRQDAEFYRGMWRSIGETGYWCGEIWDRRKNGDVYPKWLSVSAVRNSAGKTTHYIGIFSDITDRKLSEAHIEFLAYHDALTELPNRLLAMDHMALAIAHADRAGAKTAVLFLDLDNFKTINDSFGHTTGDALLKAVARRLQACTRDTDTVSRQGGDEFLIILSDVADTDAIAATAEKILAALEQTFQIEGHEIATSLSMGVAVYPDDARDVDSLLKLADIAMYHAKEAGRNAFRFYADEMNVHAVEHHRVRVGLRRALERNELVLHYQPQIELATGRVIGAEALVRWNSPDFGLLYPGDFIPIAEDSGLIVPIGDWVLREACRQAVEWSSAGLPAIVMAVNVSATQLRRGNLEQSVLHALCDSGLPPSSLELELTESILIQDTEKVLDTVQRLKAYGLMLSIDDFGTGYSSLAYLKRFDVDKLKIDRSFITDMLKDPHDATIVRAIIQMARSLNLKTIAEGVENEHLLAFLRLQYCDEAQGYHFARPMPAERFAEYLAASRSTLEKTLEAEPA